MNIGFDVYCYDCKDGFGDYGQMMKHTGGDPVSSNIIYAECLSCKKMLEISMRRKLDELEGQNIRDSRSV